MLGESRKVNPEMDVLSMAARVASSTAAASYVASFAGVTADDPAAPPVQKRCKSTGSDEELAKAGFRFSFGTEDAGRFVDARDPVEDNVEGRKEHFVI